MIHLNGFFVTRQSSFFTTSSTFEGRLKNNSWLPHVLQEIFQRDPQLHLFPQILKEKKHNDLLSKSKKSLLRNTIIYININIYILGVQQIARLAFILGIWIDVRVWLHGFYWQAWVYQHGCSNLRWKQSITHLFNDLLAIKICWGMYTATIRHLDSRNPNQLYFFLTFTLDS